MNGWLLTLPVAVPLFAAAVLVFTPNSVALQRLLSIAANGAVLVLGAVLLARTYDGSVISENLSGWTQVGIPIMFAGDAFSALMLCVTALLVMVCLGFAFATGDAAHRLFAPMALVMAAGVYGAYLTADLFNLFVFVEVMLAPSYVLLVLAGGRKRVAAGRLYLTVSLLASTIFLAGIGLVYGLAGTVNLGQLAGSASGSPAMAVAGSLILIAMGVKAALVPVHGWLPRAYLHAAPAVAALFSGLLTKVGVYVIFRLYAVMYEGDPQYAWVVMLAALLSMVVGVLGAVGEKTMRAILAFHMISQIGYMIIGPALFTTVALAAGIFYIIHHVLVKAALLICAGAVEVTYGTGRLDRLGGLVNRAPWLAAAFMVAALSLAGMPPMSGFIAKLAIVRAAILEAHYLAAVVAVLVGLLTLLSMIKIWNGAFWGHNGEATWDEEGERSSATTRVIKPSLVAPAVVLASFSLIFGIGAEPLLAATTVAAEGLTDITAYVTAVTMR
ncbi:monovalent cation/H+ antiporter subunit D family protein [Natronosporangium hydrolyticum]|uniref:Monovalent cation/H+ antiporter subunit D family protein n=1 Tax=Natronosporangium hydrolyticum TaxID=2811111 RepID=A0A895YCN8_9ACTN|nr:monovalent cation/H+ antiporter subunit D family protein [Natronosporangium hydrolyticum]QSB13109.1 monovalent cation/H+ antiporter subunit D family protein [Natronosporangium hydrolyticum]